MKLVQRYWAMGCVASSAVALATRGLTANALALKLRVPANRLSEIVRGQRGITTGHCASAGSSAPAAGSGAPEMCRRLWLSSRCTWFA